MKTTKLLVILMLITTNTFSQVPSSCIAPPELISNYDVDVKHLTLTRLIQLNSPYQDSIVIPQAYQDSIMEGLSAIFNLPNILDRDSVFDKYCIHEYRSVIRNTILVSIDLSYSWTNSWQNLQTATGIPALDNLLVTYGFSVKSYSNFLHYAVLETTQSLNLLPLCDSLMTFGGITYAEQDQWVGDGNHISYNISGNTKYYDFSIGWGDCPSGCINYHKWKYKVNPDCSVEYIGSFEYVGSPYEDRPLPTNCNITNVLQKPIQSVIINIYPNPMATSATISIPNIKSEARNPKSESSSDFDIRISDLTGKVVRLIPFACHPERREGSINKPIERGNLNPGVYIIEINGYLTKLIVE